MIAGPILCILFARGYDERRYTNSAPTKAEHACKITPETIESLITPKTKAIIIPYPNNPTGAILTKSELKHIARVLEKTEVLVISDEIYSN